MALVVMGAEKIRRPLRLFLVTIFACVCASQWPGRLWMELSNSGQLVMDESLLIGKACLEYEYAAISY